MTLIPWKGKQRQREPTGEASPLAVLRQEMDRLFDQFLREPLSGLEWPFGGPWSPPVDLAEDDREILVRAEIPGVDPQQIDLSVLGRELLVAGEKKAPLDRSGKDVHLSEIRYGKFRRSIPLPTEVDTERVEADYTNGVLTIRLQKVPSAQARRITVKG